MADDRMSQRVTPSEGLGKIFSRAEKLSKAPLLGVSSLFRWLPRKNSASVPC